MSEEKKVAVEQGVCGAWSYRVNKIRKNTPNQYGSHFFTFDVYKVENRGWGNKEYGKDCPSWEGEDKLEATRLATELAVKLEEEHRESYQAANAGETDSDPYGD